MKKYFEMSAGAVLCSLLSVSAWASDEFNMCIFNPHPSSENISLPQDDTYHYPDQWTGDPGKTNRHESGNGQESTYKVWHWTAYPRNGGKPVRIDGFQTYAGIRGPSPFAGGEMDWMRMLWVSILGPDSVYRQYFYVAPGEFAPCENCYDMQVGGPDETLVMEVTETGLIPLPDPEDEIGRTAGAGGTNMWSDFVSTDGNIEFHTQEESLKRANYPAVDGYDEILRYYWARSYLVSWGTLTYFGETYDVYGSAWDDREWQFDKPALLENQRWHWVSIQIQGCLDKHDKKIPCDLSFTTILAWDNFYNESGHPQHYWNEVGPPPFCEDHILMEQEDWTLEPLDWWISERSGIAYARELRLTAPSRGADFHITARADDQEVWKAGVSIQGLYEGAADLVGTLEGRRVWGDVMLEQYRAPTP